MKQFLLDANVIVRFMLQDEPKQASASVTLMEKAERGECLLHLDPLVVAEVIYVLVGVYSRNRVDVAKALLALIHNSGIETMEEHVVSDALLRFESSNVDFADAWLAARSLQAGFPVASFDRDFDKFKDIKRFEP